MVSALFINLLKRNFTQRFDFQSRGFLQVTLDVDRSVCSTDYDNAWSNMVWIPIVNLVFSMASMLGLPKSFQHKEQTGFNILPLSFLLHFLQNPNSLENVKRF